MNFLRLVIVCVMKLLLQRVVSTTIFRALGFVGSSSHESFGDIPSLSDFSVLNLQAMSVTLILCWMVEGSVQKKGINVLWSEDKTIFASLVKRVGEIPDFRILAPSFVCPKDKDSVIDKPDNTVITLQTDAGSDIIFTWTVRWQSLVAPTQRFTIALWKSVRDLEKQLNKQQTEPGVYIINNTELLSGVNYIFNVTALSGILDGRVEKTFHIDNIQGDHELLIEGRSNMFSILLFGGQLTYADIDYTLEAQVTMCFKTHDYYFVWSVYSGENIIDVSDEKGSTLEIKANRLTPGLSYNVLCKLFKYSSGELITENGIPFYVQHRDFNLHFNVDVLVITVNTAFNIQTNINEIDYLQNELTITWDCTLNDVPFDDFKFHSDGTLLFPMGLPDLGEYLVSVTATVHDNPVTSHLTARIITVELQLPVIEVDLVPRLMNEGSTVHLNANISDIVPGCSITWYFTYDECFSANTSVPISDPVNFYSLEENFLNELTDYTNETSSASVAGELLASSGTARVVAECKCNKFDNCSTEGIVYADVKLQVNDKPKRSAEGVLVVPETGVAMETVYRISTLALVDLNRPLRYTFYCDLGHNDTLVLGSHLEHLAIETMLPYIVDGTAAWVEVCDSLGACSIGASTTVKQNPGEARTLDTLIEDAQAFVTRCEIEWLQRLVASALITYINAGQTDARTAFTTAILDALRSIEEHCTEYDYHKYNALLHFLAKAGIDTSDFI